MYIQVRIELRSRQWKKILELWDAEPSSVRLSGVPGSVVGSFRKDSPDYEILARFYERHRQGLAIERREIERAVYGPEEKKSYPLLALFCETVYDAVSQNDFAPRESCERCGKDRPWQRNGTVVLRGTAYQRYCLFTTVSNEFFVSQRFRIAMETGSFQGAVYTPCFTFDGRPIEDYFLLTSRTHLGSRLTDDGSSWVCPLCGQIDLPAGKHYPPEFKSPRDSWSGDDLVFTQEWPRLPCCSQPLARMIFNLETTIKLDLAMPIVLS